MDKHIEQGIKDYKELQEIVRNFNGTLDELCEKLNGHNFEYNLFDVNYKSIVATIVGRENGLVMLNSIEIWDDEKCECIDDNYIVEE